MTTLQQFSLEATRRYLQTVVFVDDNIFDDTSGMAVEVVNDLPKPRKRIYQPEETSSESAALADVDVESQKNDISYRPKDLVSSFASEGIICALYEPPEDFEVKPDSDIFKLSQRPDIIILDWDLSGDNGQRTLELIAALVKQSRDDFPHHTRLIAIYTIDFSLEAVANQIGDRLTKDGFEAEPKESPCRIKSGATWILVLGKNLKRFGKSEVEFTVKDEELASRLIREFAEMNSGILPAYALHGMAAIRQNSKRILDRFHGDLNGAFLLHRALSKESEEAFDQLPELLADELQSVLEDAHLTPEAIADIASDAIVNLKLSPPTTDWRYTPGGKRFPATRYLSEAVVRELLSSGKLDRTIFPAVEQVIDISKPGFGDIGTDLMQALVSMVDSKKSQANQRLASLFAVRTQYHQSTRRLYHGSIIRQRDADVGRWIYSFCVMPVCDTIRLDRSMQFKKGQLVRFPFWKLSENVLLMDQANRRGIALLPPGMSEYLLISAGGKSRDMLWLGGFQIDETRGQVISEKSADGRFLFKSDQNVEIEWVAELKPLHAQRIAYDIGQNLSRVGLIEAEWLRLLCER